MEDRGAAGTRCRLRGRCAVRGAGAVLGVTGLLTIGSEAVHGSMTGPRDGS
jgi:hypothetical protein